MLLRSLSFICLFLTLSTQALDRSQIAADAESVTPLLNGQMVPDVTLQSPQGKPVKLLELIAQKPTVILFYRGGWCPYCNAQLAGFQEVEKKLIAMGYQILAISPETPARLMEQKFDTDYKVTQLSDVQLEATREFGIGFFLDDNTASRYRGKMGEVFASLPGDERIVLPVPAAYIVDTSGLIQFQYVNPNYKVRVNPELMVHAARMALE
ncbi:peroxiredoxin-like family protein [Aliiglaciecola sp. CAU 1673]|uniref:peroxiredoxin-like family protein n=1 Tax=Aliiglaciecola sp. CAU 1673 TaxID=3032595 RepID=UPI0023DBF32B|nr:peroxiredoxin-like family protein [Aliiglaciecola sp. CAU 1673]MDF2177973.1 peroxiredoxin-like family protein [Aliiglaciecola sp. CAU 1673]